MSAQPARAVAILPFAFCHLNFDLFFEARADQMAKGKWQMAKLVPSP
jgi:hypothetical protein